MLDTLYTDSLCLDVHINSLINCFHVGHVCVLYDGWNVKERLSVRMDQLTEDES